MRRAVEYQVNALVYKVEKGLSYPLARQVVEEASLVGASPYNEMARQVGAV